MARDQRSIISAALKSWSQPVPERITRKSFDGMRQRGIISIDYFMDDESLLAEFVRLAEQYKTTGKKSVLVLSPQRYMTQEQQNDTMKDFSNYHNLSAHSNLDAVIQQRISETRKTNPNAARKLQRSAPVTSFRVASDRKPTRELMRTVRVTPDDVASEIGALVPGTGRPHVGYGFRTFDNHYVGVPWVNLYLSTRNDLFKVEINDKMYARTVDAKVINIQDKESEDVTLKNLPVVKEGNDYLYELAWDLYFQSTSHDFKFRGLRTDKQGPTFLFASKDVVAAYHAAAKRFRRNKETRPDGARTYNVTTLWQDNPFMVPNQSFINAAEIALSGLVVDPETNEKRPWNEAIMNQFLDRVVQKYSAKKLFRQSQ